MRRKLARPKREKYMDCIKSTYLETQAMRIKKEVKSKDF